MPTSPQSERPTPLIELRAVSKFFGRTRALDDVSFALHAGQVHVIAGENGAGKSTLIRILSGVYQDYAGTLLVGGQPLRLTGPQHAAKAGIATIHQELSLVESMSVADNLWLGRSVGSLFRPVSPRRLNELARQNLADMQLDVDPQAPVESLSLAQKQLLEIGRALARKARVVIMDEPTSALNEQEAEALFERIGKLRDAGCGVIYISHRLEEIFRLADRITVLKDGRLVRTARASELSKEQLVTSIAGRELSRTITQGSEGSQDAVLALRDVNIPDRQPGRRPLIQQLSLTVRRAEIVGLAGLRGSGTSALLHGLFGSFGPTVKGSIELCAQPFSVRNPVVAIKRGMILLSSDRQTSLVRQLSVKHNASLSALPSLSRHSWVHQKREAQLVSELADRLTIVTPSLEAPVWQLSGGNQQKVALARCLLTDPRLLLLDEPTRGVDIGAKNDIYQLLRNLAEQGVAMLLVASELDELVALCDRVLVLVRGRHVTTLKRGNITRDRILRAAMDSAPLTSSRAEAM